MIFRLRVLILKKIQKLLSAIISQVRESEEDVEHNELATTDIQTKLVSHKYFHHLLKREFSLAIRYNRDLSLIIADIDFLKKINSTHGHQAGENILKDIGLILKNTCRISDTVARYNDEEISIILPETDITGAKIIAEKIQENIKKTEIFYKDRKIIITISLGIATYPDHAFDKQSILTAAENAMNISKSSGQNIISISKELSISQDTKSKQEKISDFLNKWNITAREKEIIFLIANGKSNKSICYDLHISEPTIKTHISHIYKKLEIQCRVDLANLINNLNNTF